VTEKHLARLTVGELRVRLARYDPSLEVWLEVENGQPRPATITSRCQPINPPGDQRVVIEAVDRMTFIEIPEPWEQP
jgi:hypothetical protein